MREEIAPLEKTIGHVFRRKNLLETALTHPSHSVESSYERLEFLGDIILDAVVGIHLFKEHPTKPESYLTNLKSAYVNRKFLHAVGERLRLNRYLNHRSQQTPRLDDCVEALIGAIYLDGGWKTAGEFINKYLLTRKIGPLIDVKSLLFNVARKEHNTTVSYRVVRQTGPAHQRIFEVKVVLNNKRRVGRGTATSIKEAEFNAAKDLLEKLQLKKASKNDNGRKNAVPRRQVSLQQSRQVRPGKRRVKKERNSKSGSQKRECGKNKRLHRKGR